MKIIEARDALAVTLDSISKQAAEKNLTVNVRCFIADHDLNELSEEDLGKAALIAGEIAVNEAGSEEKLLLECALSITEGEVSAEEMLREVATIRESMKELCEKLDEAESTSEAFDAVLPEPEEPEPIHVYDNKKFYIASAIGAGVIILLVLLIGGLF